MMSLASLGKPSLVAALGFALSGLVLCALGATTHRAERTHAGVRALTAAAVFTGIGALSLMNALLVHDFSLEYAANV